jgi:thiol-disulfide isomerase/thioredoxin
VKYFIYTFLLGSLLLLSSCGGDSPDQQAEQADDSPESIIENAVFTDLDGNEVKVSDFEGKLVLVDFWETWCGPCLQVFPAMQELREQYPGEFEVLAVTVGMNDTPETAKDFAEEHDYDFTWLYDENEIFSAIGGQGIPFKAYIDPQGEVIKIEMGSYGKEGDYNRTKSMIAEYFDIE